MTTRIECVTEIDSMKDLHRRGSPTAEIIVCGIPAANTISFDNLTKKILEVLNLQNLLNDVLEIRPIKITNSRRNPSSAANSNSQQNDAIATDPPSSAEVSPSKFIVAFKSDKVSQFVLKKRRQHGDINYKELVDKGEDSKLGFYEILPPAVNELRLAARESVNAKGYKYLFSNNSNLLVKKTDTSLPIPITTELDIEKIA